MTHLSESTFKFLSPYYNKRKLIQLEDEIIKFIRLAKPVACKCHLIQSSDKKRLIPFIFIQLKVGKAKKSVNAYQALTDIVSNHLSHPRLDTKKPSITLVIKYVVSDLKKIPEIKNFISNLESFTDSWGKKTKDEIQAKQALFLEKRKTKEKTELKSLLHNLKQLDWTLPEVIDTWNELLVQEVMDS